MALRQSNLIPSDLRSYLLSVFFASPPESNIVNIHPRFWAIHNLNPQVGNPDENGVIVFPPLMNLSSEKLERHGVYLIDNGFEVFIWIGKSVDPNLLGALFGVPSYDRIPDGKFTIPELGNDFNARILRLIAKIRELRLLSGTIYPHLYIVREDGDLSLRKWCLSYLIEDRHDNHESYPQFLGLIRDQVLKASA